MNCLGIVGKPLVFELSAFWTAGAETPLGSVIPQVLMGGGGLQSLAGKAVVQQNGAADNGRIEATRTVLQRMIEEILDPLGLPKRPVKEWRSLYKAFFAFFAPDGAADEAERKAWAVAADVFNTNLVAVSNRRTQVVPMTFQDFTEAVDSFRHDGLREGAQRDIAFQPKKILTLMAAMIGRIVAGWQADCALGRDPSLEPFPFRNQLIEANRKARFLGSVFDYDPRFCIVEYRTAGLKPLLRSFPHFASALIENGLLRCELCPAEVPRNPPTLCAYFRKPFRAPTLHSSLSSLHFVLLREPSPLGSEGANDEASTPDFEFSKTALDAVAFEACDSPEAKCTKAERLFELAVAGGLLVCGPHRADASTAVRISKMLGRTPAEQFAVERFFALGFRNGHGNEPWLERATSVPASFDPEKVKKARKQFGRWKSTSLFFLHAGQPQAMDIPGAVIRQEILQPKGSNMFLSLINTPVYAPLMRVLVAVDNSGGWLVDEAWLRTFARNLNGGVGETLSGAREAIAQVADAFVHKQEKAVFLLECAVGILHATVGPKSPKPLAACNRALDALRQDYERMFGVSLSEAPSLVRMKVAEHAAHSTQTKTQFEGVEQTVVGLMAEPPNRTVSPQMRDILAAATDYGNSLQEQPVPVVQLENSKAFETSIVALCNWLKAATGQKPNSALSAAGKFLAACVEVRSLAEEGKTEAALARLSVIYPTLSEGRKQALAPVFGELTWALLQSIEGQMARGNMTEAAAMAESAISTIQHTPLRDEFKSLLQTLFTSSRTPEATGAPNPSTEASAPGPTGARALRAEELLRDYADELNLAENHLEREFLRAVRDGLETSFKRKEKLRSRLQRRTRWGGREPYRTALRLVESTSESEA